MEAAVASHGAMVNTLGPNRKATGRRAGYPRERVTGIGVLLGCFGIVDGDSWFTWWFNHLPGKPIYSPKRTPMVTGIHWD